MKGDQATAPAMEVPKEHRELLASRTQALARLREVQAELSKIDADLYKAGFAAHSVQIDCW